MKKILVPVDFSRESINAFRFALDIASQSNGTIWLLHVISLPVLQDSFLMPVGGLKKELLDGLKNQVEKKFARMTREFNSKAVTIHTNVITGRLDTTIRDFIDGEKIDLVVMGTKGATGMKEWTVGSNTEKIVRSSPVPLIAIKHYTPGQLIKNIVFPNTLETENQEELITKIKALQYFFNAQLHIIWVNTPTLFKPEAEVRQQLAAFAKRFMLKDYTINVFNYTNEESGIAAFTNQTRGDLIAMGTHGLTGLAHLLSGSVAEDVVNHVGYPVWTYCTKPVKTLLH
jgi:nucleotide-binding universal stress UspA family protein